MIYSTAINIVEKISVARRQPKLSLPRYQTTLVTFETVLVLEMAARLDDLTGRGLYALTLPQALINEASN